MKEPGCAVKNACIDENIQVELPRKSYWNILELLLVIHGCVAELIKIMQLQKSQASSPPDMKDVVVGATNVKNNIVEDKIFLSRRDLQPPVIQLLRCSGVEGG